jgi:hypothetical protein
MMRQFDQLRPRSDQPKLMLMALEISLGGKNANCQPVVFAHHIVLG